jgi:CelD/BcsL family acetyltransferase involved in cellulose biosynthesis
VRAALSAHERVKAQRAQVRRLEAATGAPVSTLPFVFESELELDHYRALAEALLDGG